VGGLFREQGLEVVTKWLNAVFQPHVEAVYQYFRNDYLMLSGPQAVLYPRVPTASYPSPPSEGVGPGLSSRPTGERHRSLPPRTNEPQQGSGRVGGSMENRPEVIDQSRSNRRRRRSGQVDSSRRGDPGKRGLVSPRDFSMAPLTRFRFPRCTDDTWSPHRRTGSDNLKNQSARKRTRY
jgi:hypothetical protein